jgi:predicted O-methyltransferase YrrM
MLEQFRARYRRRCQRQEHVRQERQARRRAQVGDRSVAASAAQPPRAGRASPVASVDAEWLEVKASLDRLMVIEDGKTGGVNVGDRRALYYLVRALRPRVLEIGTDVGEPTMSIAVAMKRNGAAPGEGAFITVDIEDIEAPNASWRRAGLPRSPRDNLMQLGAADGVQFVTMPALRYFDQTDDSFDLIFLDGDHSATAVYQEISRALVHLRDGGVVVMHDFFPKRRPLWNDGAMIAGPCLAV